MRKKSVIKKAVHRADGTAVSKLHRLAYPRAESLSIENLQDQIGLLLWFLCSPINQRQSVAGYSLLEVLISAKYEQGAL